MPATPSTHTFKLNTGARVPAIGLGTWQSTETEGFNAVKTALQAGYRHIDLAWRYGNRKAVREGIQASGVPRESLFITDKLWQTWHSRAAQALDESLEVRAIGGSNCSTKHLKQILEVAKIVPAVNQVELHPSLPQGKLAEFCKEKGIQLVAHSPLGSPDSKLLTEGTLVDFAAKRGVTPAQCLISWGVQMGWAVLPKSVGSIAFHQVLMQETQMLINI